MKKSQELENLWEAIQDERVAPADLKRTGYLALQQGDFYIARKVFTILGDSEKLQVCAEQALASSRDWAWDAALAFQTLENRDGLFRALLQQEKRHSTHNEKIAQMYIGKKTEECFRQDFRTWNRKKGFRQERSVNPHELIMAHALAGKYDVGIGIAKAGLAFAYLSSLLGLETYVADCHRKGRKNTSFAWKDEVHIKEGSRVLVLDIDVVSGRTSERVLQEILKYQPREVDLALTLDPKQGPYTLGSIVENIPQGYEKVYFPKDFSCNHFPQAVQRLENALEK